ncbi:MAG TPA: hypothetical protein VKE74_18190, partial [Gemmataceae bacterium]|nr:hypothetical protein [Gemmataceae bacterium]
FMVPNDTATPRRGASADSAFLLAVNGGFEVEVPRAHTDSGFAHPALEPGSVAQPLPVGRLVGSTPSRAPRVSSEWAEPATSNDFWSGVFVDDPGTREPHPAWRPWTTSGT